MINMICFQTHNITPGAPGLSPLEQQPKPLFTNATTRNHQVWAQVVGGSDSESYLTVWVQHSYKHRATHRNVDERFEHHTYVVTTAHILHTSVRVDTRAYTHGYTLQR